jgi:transcriptional regulator with XRE-family HTH domain
MSQEELALRAGLDRTYVSGIERGRRNPSLKSMQRLAAELSISLDVAFKRARDLADAAKPTPAPKRVRK